MNKTFLCMLCLLLVSITCQGQIVIEAVPDSLSKIYVNEVYPEARFPGDSGSLATFLQKNLQTGLLKANGAPPGVYKVEVRFIVWFDGRGINFSPETNNGYGIEAEVIRVIKSGPKWLPALRYGRKVHSYKRQIVMIIIPGG